MSVESNTQTFSTVRPQSQTDYLRYKHQSRALPNRFLHPQMPTGLHRHTHDNTHTHAKTNTYAQTHTNTRTNKDAPMHRFMYTHLPVNTYIHAWLPHTNTRTEFIPHSVKHTSAHSTVRIHAPSNICLLHNLIVLPPPLTSLSSSRVLYVRNAGGRILFTTTV